MNKLTVRKEFRCNTCGCVRKLKKTFRVNSITALSARAEAKEMIDKWNEMARKGNCQVCASIIRSL